ncbi:MAG: SAM-dependent methyltransferase, partial [Planctomycetota bacterium]|nr:SAM-dependent methyltransferase [Planctomycetota bacterium]
SGRPTLLLSLDGADEENFPEPLRWYLREGERLGLPRRPLISRRNPWYKMEKRVPPPFLFAYLGRRRSRFIRNTASAVPLTGFLCVYPKKAFEKQLDRIWKILNHPDTFSNLQMVGKSYGSGAIKVEPRLLERLPIPDHVVEQSGISLFQGRLF